MLCKKCGANIEDNSKFCGYCGNAVEISNEPQTGVVENQPVQENLVNEPVDLGQTARIEPVQPVLDESLVQQPVESVSHLQQNNGQEPVNEPVMQTNLDQNPNVQQPMNNQIPENGPTMQSVSQPSNNKKNNKLLFIIGGAVLAVVAVVLVVLAFMKSSGNSVAVLDKALNHLANGNTTSITLDTGISLATSTGETFSFSLTVKSENKAEDQMDMQMTLNKSLFFDEMNVYLTQNKKEMTMYVDSSLVDMLGMTSSLTPTWLYYTLPLDEIMEEMNTKVQGEEIKLQDLIDEEHFEYVDGTENLKHYVLLIDQKLIDSMKDKLSNVNDESVREMLDSMETLEETIKVDFYITDSNELSRIELNMTEFLEDSEGISEFVLSITFRDLNNTKVEIPRDAKNSITDLETYMSNNSIESGLDYDSSVDYDTDFDWDYDSSIDYDTDFDWDYDYTVDSNLGDIEFGV